MGRPIKNNAEYFSHDADMRNDIKVKALRRRFSHKGYAVWCYLLETLTAEDGFELDYGDLQQELLAADFDTTVEELREIVEYCRKLGLLVIDDEGGSVTRLYSAGLKRRLSEVAELREKRSRAGKAGMAARWNNDGNNKALQVDNTVITTDNEVKESKEKEKKEKESVYPYQEVADLWNDICGGKLPRVKILNDNRRQKIKLRLGEFGDKGSWLETARNLFSRVAASDFLCGANQHGWVATFDWLFENPTNWVKVSEGNYDNDRGGGNKAAGGSATLGVGEWIDPATGRRTYGTGRATIPADAPPRPSERHSWDAASKTWLLL